MGFSVPYRKEQRPEQLYEILRFQCSFVYLIMLSLVSSIADVVIYCSQELQDA